MSGASSASVPESVAAVDLRRTIETFKRDRLVPAGRAGYPQRLAAFNALSDALIARDPDVLRVLPATGLAFAAGFLRATNLEHLVARELRDSAALERFVRIEPRKSLRVLPRGLAAHWIAGNVPLLGLFSWALSALVGNVNVLRLSSRGEDFMTPILRVLARVGGAGAELAADTMVLRFPTEDLESHRAMSEAADVRIAWGGQDAVAAVSALPAAWDCETVILGPRMSLAVIDAELLVGKALTRLATDIAYFDQQACSSPQWVFVKTSGSESRDAVAQRIAGALAAQAARLPRRALEAGETYRIALDRSRVLMDGGVLHRDEHTAWTVAVVDVPDKRVTCADRFVQVVPISDVDEVSRYIPRNVQTVVMLLSREDGERFSDAAARHGVHRLARPGEGNFFESPWDGIPLFSRLARWTLRTDAPEGAENPNQ